MLIEDPVKRISSPEILKHFNHTKAKKGISIGFSIFFQWTIFRAETNFCGSNRKIAIYRDSFSLS